MQKEFENRPQSPLLGIFKGHVDPKTGSLDAEGKRIEGQLINAELQRGAKSTVAERKSHVR